MSGLPMCGLVTSRLAMPGVFVSCLVTSRLFTSRLVSSRLAWQMFDLSFFCFTCLGMPRWPSLSLCCYVARKYVEYLPEIPVTQMVSKFDAWSCTNFPATTAETSEPKWCCTETQSANGIMQSFCSKYSRNGYNKLYMPNLFYSINKDRFPCTRIFP